MFVFFAEGIAIPILAASGILWNGFKGQFGDGCKALAGVFGDVANGGVVTMAFNLLDHCLHLVEKQGGCEDRTSIDD